MGELVQVRLMAAIGKTIDGEVVHRCTPLLAAAPSANCARRLRPPARPV